MTAPVLVTGAPRSGLTLLACSLGQHDRLRPLPDAGWLGPLLHGIAEAHRRDAAVGARGQLTAAGISAAAFHRTFGRVIGEVLGCDGAERPVAASAEIAEVLPAALLALPGAQVVHVIASPAHVVRSLGGVDAGDGYYAGASHALAVWDQAVRAALHAEAVHGPEVVHRLLLDELVDDPEPVTARCLRFLGEAPSRACLAPLIGLRGMASADGGDDAVDVPAPVADLFGRLAAGAPAEDVLAAAAPAMADGRRLQPAALRVRDLVRRVVPDGARALVISKGDPALADGRDLLHFPHDGQGGPAGYHPADSDEACRLLSDDIALGAEYLVIPGPMRWWLDHYDGFAAFLHAHAHRVADQDDVGVVYRLRGDAAAGGGGRHVA
jgi:hypothetical protein